MQKADPKVAYYCRLFAVERVRASGAARARAPAADAAADAAQAAARRAPVTLLAAPPAALPQALEFPKMTPEIRGVVESIFPKLETDKKALQVGGCWLVGAGAGRALGERGAAATQARAPPCPHTAPHRTTLQQLNPEEDAAHCEVFALTLFNRADKADRAGRADKATAVTFYAASYFLEVLAWALPWPCLRGAGLLVWRRPLAPRARRRAAAPTPSLPPPPPLDPPRC